MELSSAIVSAYFSRDHPLILTLAEPAAAHTIYSPTLKLIAASTASEAAKFALLACKLGAVCTEVSPVK